MPDYGKAAFDLASKNNNQIIDLSTNKAEKTYVDTELTKKTSKTYVDQQITNIGNASPKGTYATLSDLQAAFPAGTTGIYVVTADGKWYYWNGTAWTAGGVYQATGVADGSVKVTSTNFLVESNVGNNLVSAQIFKTSGYYQTDGSWVSDSNYFSIVDYIPVQQNVKYSNNFYSVRGYDVNGNVTFAQSNNKAPITFTDGVTVKIRPNFKVADTNTSAAYVYKVGYIANDLLLNNGNIPDGLITGSKIPDKALSIDKLNDDVQKYFPSSISNWETGYIGSTGTLTPSNNNVRTKNYIYLKSGTKISLKDSSFTFKVISYNYANGVYTFITRTDILTTYTIPSDGYYKFQVQKSDLTDISDVNTTGQLLVVSTDSLLATKKQLDESLASFKPNDIKVNPYPTEKFMHISCDDFLTPFKDLTTNANTYTSIFDNAVFGFLKSQHDKYGMVFSAYCFYESTDATFNLSQVPNKFSKEFRDNSHWLKFGFHSRNGNKNYATATAADAKTDYDLIITELIRITGSYKCIDRLPRLQNYAGSLDAVTAMKNTKPAIVGLLTAEDTRTNYYHNADQTNYLLAHDRLYDNNTKLLFFSTDIRLDTDSTPKTTLETRETDSNFSDRMNDLVIFIHDDGLIKSSYWQRVTDCLEYAIENGYRFDFPMNVTMR